MSKKLIFATHNMGKVNEIKQILGDGYQVLSLKDVSFTDEIEETGTTFEENATIKAVTLSKELGEIVLADDSGFEVDYLKGEPGIYSSRYLGEDTPYEVKNRTILERCQDAKDEERGARFVCAMACAFPDGRLRVTKGVIEGVLAKEPAGTNGFGYDPIFYLPERKMTTGEMTPEDKNAISHRGIALRKMVEVLKEEGVLHG